MTKLSGNCDNKAMKPDDKERPTAVVWLAAAVCRLRRPILTHETKGLIKWPPIRTTHAHPGTTWLRFVFVFCPLCSGFGTPPACTVRVHVAAPAATSHLPRNPHNPTTSPNRLSRRCCCALCPDHPGGDYGQVSRERLSCVPRRPVSGRDQGLPRGVHRALRRPQCPGPQPARVGMRHGHFPRHAGPRRPPRAR